MQNKPVDFLNIFLQAAMGHILLLLYCREAPCCVQAVLDIYGIGHNDVNEREQKLYMGNFS